MPGMRTYEEGAPLMLEELKAGRLGASTLVTGRSSDCECVVS